MGGGMVAAAGPVVDPAPRFGRMSALAAALPLGGVGWLVGATTEAVVLVARRVSAGARGLILMGEITLWQADGTEFDGDYQWLPVGAAAAPTWGVAGDITTGGMIVPEGAVTLRGLRGIRGLRRAATAEWVVDSVPASPLQHDALISGAVRYGGSPRLLYGGGVGYGTGGKIRGAVCLGDDPDAFTVDVSTDAEGTFTGQARALTHYSMHRRSSTDNLAGYCGAWTGLDSNADGGDSIRLGPNTTPVEANFDDYELALARQGAWVARCVSVVADYGA